jgi:flagellar assembly factor FliW
MTYNIRGELLGFPDTLNVEVIEIDELFSTLKDIDNENISFTVVNPYLLREYSFDVPSDVKVLLDIKKESKLSVYNILVVQKPLEKSVINFLAPIIINHDNNKLAQVVLEPAKHPDFGMAESIESFKA